MENLTFAELEQVDQAVERLESELLNVINKYVEYLEITEISNALIAQGINFADTYLATNTVKEIINHSVEINLRALIED